MITQRMCMIIHTATLEALKKLFLSPALGLAWNNKVQEQQYEDGFRGSYKGGTKPPLSFFSRFRIIQVTGKVFCVEGNGRSFNKRCPNNLLNHWKATTAIEEETELKTCKSLDHTSCACVLPKYAENLGQSCKVDRPRNVPTVRFPKRMSLPLSQTNTLFY